MKKTIPDTTAAPKPNHGIDWERSTLRPGCQDFLKVPTLVDGKRKDHVAPVHGCVSNSPRFDRGTK